MRIAICEDNGEHTEILAEMVNRWAKKREYTGCYWTLLFCGAVSFLHER